MNRKNQELIDSIHAINSIDLDALQDAQFTLQAIKDADPGTYDEMIDESLTLINKALNLSFCEAVEQIAKQLGVDE